jgi:hypothetical protein
MAIDLLNRRISFVAAFFAFVGVVLGVVALSTNYWTIQQFSTPGTALQTPNGTFFTGENVHWTWNVSFIYTKLISSEMFFFQGSFLSMYNTRKCSMCNCFLVNNIRHLFIRINIFIRRFRLYLLGCISN